MNPVATESEKSDISDSMSRAGTCDWNIPLPQKEGRAQKWMEVCQNIVANLKELSLTKSDARFEHQNNDRNGLEPTE